MAYLAHNSKRRRLEQAASTLSKPFKSPLRTPVQKADQAASSSSLRLTAQIKSEKDIDETDGKAHQLQQQDPQEETKFTADTKPTPAPTPSKALQQTTPLLSLRKRKSFVSSSNSILSADPVVSALQKQHTALQVRLSSLRAELDTTQQALRIESSSRDEELEALILKWRAASQDVAEELFASARDKVFRMGGVRAWKERAKKSRERWDGGEDDLAIWGQDLDEDELERRKVEILDSIDTDSRAERDGGREDEDDDDQESFTMDMMLKSLNIDLDMIGFDKISQGWIKD